MVDAVTSNYGYVLPEVNGSDDTWGDKLNQNWVDVDAQLNTVANQVSTIEGRSITAGSGLSGGGTLAASRTLALGTPGTITASSTNSVTASSHTHAISLTAADVGAPPTTRSLTAGNGLSGGGDLTANRTFTLGTPGSLNAASTNSVTATSHTHSISLSASDVGAPPTTRSLTAGSGLSGGGDLSANRTFTLGTPGTLTGGTTNSVTASSHTHDINLSAADVGAPPTSRSITAGSGLSGGGDLSANRTLTLGTPGTLSGGTTNALQATSHTHAISSTASRTDTSTATLLQAKSMNDHRLSGDHNSLYYMKSEVDSRKALVGGYSKTLDANLVRFMIWKPLTQDLNGTTGLQKVTWSTTTTGRDSQSSSWYYPAFLWDITNHRFVAPVAGKYFFWLNIVNDNGVQNGVSNLNCMFVINENALTDSPRAYSVVNTPKADGTTARFYNQAHLSAVLSLNAGDTVSVYQTENGIAIGGWTDQRYTKFGGFLL